MTYLGRLRSSRANAALQKVLRVFQFLSPVISLGLFSSRVVKIARLSHRLTVTHRLTTSDGAVEGILAAAVLYTLAVMILTFFIKHGGPKLLRWLLMAMDLLFMGAFVAVAYLTRPNGGSSGPCRNTNKYEAKVIPKGQNCSLPWGTFILAIVSALLHFLTALFHEVKDRKHDKLVREGNENGYGHGNGFNGNSNGNANGNGYGNGNDYGNGNGNDNGYGNGRAHYEK